MGSSRFSVSLFERTDAEWVEQLQLWQESGSLPTDPHEALLWAARPAGPDWPGKGQTYGQARRNGFVFQSLLAELRLLGPLMPLRHREFLQLIQLQAERTRQLRAVSVLSVVAREGDQDALQALVRGAVEGSPEVFEAVATALSRLSPPLTELPLAHLYQDDPWEPVFERLHALLLPELEAPPQVPKPDAPRTSPDQPETTVSVQKARPRKWHLQAVEGEGRLLLSPGIGRAGRLYQVANESITGPDGFLHRTYQSPPGSYQGAGDSRPIRRCLLSTDQNQLLLCFRRDEAEILGLSHSPPLLGLVPNGDWRFWSGLQHQRCLLAGPTGLYLAQPELALERLWPEPILACAQQGPRALARTSTALWREKAEPVALPPCQQAVFCPRARHLASLLSSPPCIQIHNLSSLQLVGEIPLNESTGCELNFSFDGAQLLTSVSRRGADFWSLQGDWLGFEEERTLLMPPEITHQGFEERSLEELQGSDRFFGELGRR